jgi:hypothetical protein
MVLWSFWSSTIKEIYRGRAQVIKASAFVGAARSNSKRFAFVSVEVPGCGWLTAEIPAERAQALLDSAVDPLVDVEVVVCKALAGKPFVAGIKWPGEEHEESEGATADGAALLVALVYFFAGFGTLLVPMLTVAEVAFICSGFVCGWSQLKGKRLDGKGIFALVVPGVLLAVLTFAIFQQMSILVLFPGIVVAFSFGQIGGMLAAGCRRKVG